MKSTTFPLGILELIIFKNGYKVTPQNFPALFRSVSACRIEVKCGRTSNVTVTLTPSLTDGLAILSSGILGFGGADVNLPGDQANQIIVQSQGDDGDTTKPSKAPSNFTYYAVRLRYPNGDSTPYFGGVTCVPTIELGSTIEIKVQFTGIQTLMAITGGPVRFENKSVLDALTELAGKFGVEIVFDDDDTTTKAQLSKATITASFNEDYDGIIRKILADNACVFTKHDGDGDQPKPQYRIKSVKQFENTAPTYTFAMYRQVAPEDGIIPITDLRLESPGILFQPGNLFGTFSAAVLSKTKEVKTSASSGGNHDAAGGSGNHSDGGSTPTDSGAAQDMNTSTGLVDATARVAGNYGYAVHRDDASTLDSAKARAEIARQNVLNFRVTTPGLPLLMPQAIVGLAIGSGTGGLEAFCGSCWVDTVIHDWSEQGWSTETLLMKGGGPILNQGGAQRAAPVPAAPDGKVTRTPTVTR